MTQRELPTVTPEELPPCPKCGEQTLHLELRLLATNGCVSGTTLKVSAKEWPHLVCHTCGFMEAGKYDA